MLARILRILTRGIFHLLMRIPQRSEKNVILFGSAFGFQDNSKYLYLRYLEQSNVQNVYWVAKTRDTYFQLRDANRPAVMRGSLSWFKACYNCRVAFFTHGIPDIAPSLPKQTIKFNLWHGTPIKKVGLDTPMGQKRKKLRAYFGLKDVYDSWDFLLAANMMSKKNFLKSTGLPDSKIKIFRQPRNHLLHESQGPNLKSNLILYMPTFRDNGSSEHITDMILIWEEVYKLTGFKLCLKLHPLEKVEMSEFNKTWIVHPETISKDLDPVSLYLNSFALITDYSSCIFDYAILGRPIKFFVPDIESYIKLRGDGFYLDFDKISNGNIIRSAADIIEIIEGGLSVQYSSELLKLVDDVTAPKVIDGFNAL